MNETTRISAESCEVITGREKQIVHTTYLLSFISGAAALIYQVAWLKMVSLSFGSTTLAAGAVIGSFMAGMGIGARYYDSVYRRIRHAFKLYAALEVGIAVGAFLITLTMYSLPQLYANVFKSIDNPVALILFRFVSVFILLFIPAALMGATFPALCTALIRSSSRMGRHLGMIYGLNTIGAAAGSVAAGFILIEAIGNQASTWVANGCNIAVALTALWLWTKVKGSELDDIPQEAETSLDTPLPRIIVGIVLVGSGISTMAYEVFWIRALKYVVGNSTYAISMVLVIFLTGLGLGGLLFRWVVKRKNPGRDLGVTQLAIALTALIAIWIESGVLTQPWFAQHLSIYSTKVISYSWPIRLFIASCISVILLLPPTIFMGLSFPLASRLYVSDVKKLGSSIGRAYLLANIGSIVGVVTAASLLLPTFGTGGATKVIAIVNTVLGLVVLIYFGKWSFTKIGGTVAAVASIALLIAVIPHHLEFKGEFESKRSEVIFNYEGDIGTVKVLRPIANEPMQVMTIDGYVIGVGGREDMLSYKQRLLAHFPMLLKPNARTTLNIGLGSGSTLATLSGYENLETLDCVEIVPGVPKGAKYFDEYASMDDPRVKVYLDDAVHFLLTSEKTYDVIIADGKQNPKFAGNAAILSEEFHSYCRNRLADDGVLIEWLSPSLHPRAFEATLRSFSKAFPEVAAYYFVPTALAIIGSKQPIGDNPNDWPVKFATEQAQQHMAHYHIEDPMTLLTSRICEGPELRKALGEGELNTWDYPILEFIHYKQFRLADDIDYAYRNIKLLHECGLLAPPDKMHGKVKRFYESTRITREGFLEFLSSQDREKLRPYVMKAIKVNRSDSIAKSLLRRIHMGNHALLDPSAKAD